MKKMLILALALMMALCAPAAAYAEAEETASCLTLTVPVPADWQREEQAQENMLMQMYMPTDEENKQAIMIVGMDLQDPSVAAMTMYVYKLMLGEEETLKQMVLQMVGTDGSEEAEQAQAILDSMKISASETTLDGREAMKIIFSMEVQGEPACGSLVITVDGQYNYMLMYMANTADQSGLDYFDTLLERAAFAEAAEAAA